MEGLTQNSQRPDHTLGQTQHTPLKAHQGLGCLQNQWTQTLIDVWCLNLPWRRLTPHMLIWDRELTRRGMWNMDAAFRVARRETMSHITNIAKLRCLVLTRKGLRSRIEPVARHVTSIRTRAVSKTARKPSSLKQVTQKYYRPKSHQKTILHASWVSGRAARGFGNCKSGFGN